MGTHGLGCEEQETINCPRHHFVNNPKSYDYVFVGAGATGATAAAKLIDDLNKVDELRKKGFSVLVLEGGVDKPSTLSPVPVDHPQASEDPNVLADPNRTGTGSGYWVRHFDDDKQALTRLRCFNDFEESLAVPENVTEPRFTAFAYATIPRK